MFSYEKIIVQELFVQNFGTSFHVISFCLIIAESMKRVEEITGKKIEFQKVNLLDKEGLGDLFKKVNYLFLRNL